ncbi:MAG: metal ABC transporter permease, partial [Bdellovibrionota bacterium]
LSIRASGMIYTFGCLVLPALFARSICREVGQMLWVAPLTGLSASIAGFILANSYDLPPGQMVTVLLCAFLPAGWVVRSQRERRGQTRNLS